MNESSDPDRRRIRRYVVARSTLMNVLNGRVAFEQGQLPRDASFVHVKQDVLFNYLHMYVCSSTFDVVPDGESVPEAGPLLVLTVPPRKAPTEWAPPNDAMVELRDRAIDAHRRGETVEMHEFGE